VAGSTFSHIFWITILANPTVLPQLLRFRDAELVNPGNTSQICSGYGQIVKKELSVRKYSCPFCSLFLDRAHNATLIFSVWDYNLFVKQINASHFSEGSRQN
jgi:Putative transposase DNA-binding domain